MVSKRPTRLAAARSHSVGGVSQGQSRAVETRLALSAAEEFGALHRPTTATTATTAPQRVYVVGSTLKNVLMYAGVGSGPKSTLAALKSALEFLRSAATAVDCGARGAVSASGTSTDSTDSADWCALAYGMLYGHVERIQVRELEECNEQPKARSFLGKNGMRDIAVGLAASVLVSHHIMVSTARGLTATDVTNLQTTFERAVDGAINLALNCRQAACLLPRPAKEARRRSTGQDQGRDQWAKNVNPLYTELRTLQRMRAALRSSAVPGDIGKCVNPIAAFKRVLELVRSAAYPATEEIGVEAHEGLCARIEAGALSTGSTGAEESALEDPVCDGRGHDGDGHDGYDGRGLVVPLHALQAGMLQCGTAASASAAEDTSSVYSWSSTSAFSI